MVYVVSDRGDGRIRSLSFRYVLQCANSASYTLPAVRSALSMTSGAVVRKLPPTNGRVKHNVSLTAEGALKGTANLTLKDGQVCGRLQILHMGL